MAKDTYYFQHDFEPTGDAKIQALIGEHGATGYGIFWRIVEMLHTEEIHKLPKKDYIFIAIGKQMSTSVEQVKAIVNYCIDVCELFTQDSTHFWSVRVLRNIERREDIKKKRSKAGKASVEARQNSTSDEQVLTSVQQNSTKERKGKEKKENDIKEDDIINSPLSSFGFDDIENYKKDCLRDEMYFIAPLCQHYGNLGLKPENIEKHLTDFNTHLMTTANNNKSKTEYRTHFKNWLPKVLEASKPKNVNYGNVPTRII